MIAALMALASVALLAWGYLDASPGLVAAAIILAIGSLVLRELPLYRQVAGASDCAEEDRPEWVGDGDLVDVRDITWSGWERDAA